MIDIETLKTLGTKARKEKALARQRGEIPRLVTKTDLAKAIRKKCYECMGGEDAPGVRTDIGGCTSGPESRAPCSLWPHRPHQSRAAKN